MGGAAVGVAGVLVQQDHQGQRAVRLVQPGVELARRGGHVGGAAMLAKALVEGLVLVEPLLRPGVAPERDDVLRLSLIHI